MSIPCTLTDMPEDVLREISQSLDFRSIHCLRKICSYLRNCVDEIQPAADLTSLEVYTQESKVYVLYIYDKKYETIEYQQTDNGCLVIQDYISKLLEKSNFKEVFQHDFIMMLKFQKSTLNRFRLHSEDLKDLGIYLNALKSRKYPLKVRELGTSDKETLRVLSFFSPILLNRIEVCHQDLVEDLPNTWKIEELLFLDHWENLKEISIGKYAVDTTLHNFGGFCKVKLTIKEILADEVVGLIKTLLSTDFISHKYFFLEFYQERQLLNRLGPAGYIGRDDLDKRKLRWYYWIPNSQDKQVMEVSYTNGRKKKFEFTRLLRHVVNWEANIQSFEEN